MTLEHEQDCLGRGWYWWMSEEPPFDIWHGNTPVASALTIDAAEVICTAVNDWLQRHPDTQLVLGAAQKEEETAP